MDDTEHYDAGAEHLPIIVRELGAGSLGTGIGYSWHKFSAYATDWGAYAASLVESTLSAVAKDLQVLLNGTCVGSTLARDSLREGMEKHPEEAADFQGVAPNAMRLLAGYGWYLTVAADRTISRILNAVETERAIRPHLMVGAFDVKSHDRASSLCRVGLLANTIRGAVGRARAQGIPTSTWARQATWTPLLAGSRAISPAALARAAARALAQAASDWAAECAMFHASAVGAALQEDWPDRAWEDPWSPNLDLRGRHLDAIVHLPFQESEYGLYGDGGYSSRAGATFAAQARSFGPLGDFWGSSEVVTDSLSSRMPMRYGSESVTTHTAELAAMVTSLRWRKPGDWHMLVFDRSALFDVLERVAVGSMNKLRKASCYPLEARLRAICVEQKEQWTGSERKPSWRLRQETFPQLWNVRRPEKPGSDVQKWFCRLPFCRAGMVGVDVKSHQEDDPCPHQAIVQGNEVQNTVCDDARRFPVASDIHVPAGSFLVFWTRAGRYVTRAPEVAIREAMREQALQRWRGKPVQGKLAQMRTSVYTACLDQRFYTRCEGQMG